MTHKIQYSARSAHSYIIYCLSPFTVVAVLVCRHFAHTPTSSGHVHVDRQRYDMACCVTREWASDVAENLREFSCTERSVQSRGMTLN